jgi:hypothetical protein
LFLSFELSLSSFLCFLSSASLFVPLFLLSCLFLHVSHFASFHQFVLSFLNSFPSSTFPYSVSSNVSPV